MHTSLTRRTWQHGASRLPALLSLVVLIGGGVMAYRHFFTRPGESAIALVPDDAALVVTLDTNPSPQQVPVFKSIADALKRENLDAELNKALSPNGAKGGAALMNEIRPYWTNSFACAMLRRPGVAVSKDSDFVVLAAVSDSGAVRNILEKEGTKTTQEGMDYYAIPKDQTCATLISNYVVFSDKPGPLARINAVYKGEARPMTTLADYQAARAALPSDATMMLFVAPSAWTEMMAASSSDKSLTATSLNTMKTAKWIAFGMTLRDTGLEFTTQMPIVAPNGVTLPAPPAPLRSDLAKHLPSGAYGLMTLAQPGRYWDWVQVAAAQNPSLRTSLDDGVRRFEHESGLSVSQDVLPGFNGDATLAIYPDATKSAPEGVDFLAEFDDANGSNPAGLAEKVRALVERESNKEGRHGVRFVSTQRGSATLWSLNSASQDTLQHAIIGSPETAPSPSSSPHGPLPTVTSPGDPPSSSPPISPDSSYNSGEYGSGKFASSGYVSGGRNTSGPQSQASAILRNKTVAYAQVGNTVLMASSQAMLDRALAAYQSGTGTLADDPHYGAMLKSLPTGSQSAMLVSVPQIMATVRPVLVNAMKNDRSGLTPDDFTQIFGGDTAGLVASGHYDGKTATSTLLFPLSYDKLIHIIGTFSKQGNRRGTAPTGSITTM